MIADLADIYTNNEIGVPSYSKQSYGNTVSDRKNSSGNGFRFPDKRYQGAANYGHNWQSQSERNLQTESQMRIRTRNKWVENTKE